MGILSPLLKSFILFICCFLGSGCQWNLDPLSEPSKPNCNHVAPELIAIPGGNFEMGRTKNPELDCLIDTSLNEVPPHNITLNKFKISKYEVTVDQFKQFIDCQDSSYRTEAENLGFSYLASDGSKRIGVSWKTDLSGKIRSESDMRIYPVMAISYSEAISYCNWLSDATGRRFSLPTEAQWEYAARGGTNIPDFLYSGSDNPDEVAWYDTTLQSIGLKEANGLGLHDMSGNLYEWCLDFYNGNLYKSRENISGITDPVQSVSVGDTRRVLRGGAFTFNKCESRITIRGAMDPGNGPFADFGFRIVEL